MLQYLLTGLAGIAIGIVGLRVWQGREISGSPPESAEPAQGSSPAFNLALLAKNKLLIGAGVLVFAAAVVLMVRSGDDATPGPAMATAGGAGNRQVSDVDTMISRLADRLAKNPNDGDGFRMLGWSYVMTGKPAEALAPYRRALALLPNRSDVHAGYGEALTGAGGGTVSAEAKAEFERAIAIKPDEPRAKYFLALWQAQNGQEREALDKWVTLANSGPADAPWQADVRQQIAATSARLGIDVSAKLRNAAPPVASGQPPVIPSDAVRAAGALPEADRQAMVDQMVTGLADRLKSNPRDPEGWARLLRSRMVLGQGDQAGRDLQIARGALKDDASGLAAVNTAARDLGVPGA